MVWPLQSSPVGRGEAAECRVHIFHLKAAGRQNWGKMEQAIARIGLVPVDTGAPEELQAFVRSEIVRWRDVVERSGAAAD